MSSLGAIRPRPALAGPSRRFPPPPRAQPDRDDNVPVFALQHGVPTLADVRDAIETCDLLAGSGRASCFAQFGVDAAAADAYYTPVAALQAALDASPAAGAAPAGRGDEGGGFEWPPRLPPLPRPW